MLRIDSCRDLSRPVTYDRAFVMLVTLVNINIMIAVNIDVVAQLSHNTIIPPLFGSRYPYSLYSVSGTYIYSAKL